MNLPWCHILLSQHSGGGDGRIRSSVSFSFAFVELALLYINDKRTEKEIKKATPFTIAKNNIKYLVVSLTK